MVKGAGRKSCFLVFTRVLGDIFCYFVNYINLRNRKMQIRGKTRRFLLLKVRPIKLGGDRRLCRRLAAWRKARKGSIRRLTIYSRRQGARQTCLHGYLAAAAKV